MSRTGITAGLTGLLGAALALAPVSPGYATRAPATNLTPINDDILVVTAPAHAAGTVDLVLSTPGGSATLVNGYTYVAPPEVMHE